MSTFCGKCRQHKPGGVGTGRRYRCPRCHAERLAAILTGAARIIGPCKPDPSRQRRAAMESQP